MQNKERLTFMATVLEGDRFSLIGKPVYVVVAITIMFLMMLMGMNLPSKNTAFAESPAVYAYDTSKYDVSERNWSPNVEHVNVAPIPQYDYSNNYYPEPEQVSYTSAPVDESFSIDLSEGY